MRSALLEMKRNLFLGSYLAKVERERGTEVNYENFLQVVSSILSKYGD